MISLAASAATIAEVVKQARGGETIALAGDIPLLAIANRSFSPPVTITGGRVGQINLSNCQGVVLSGVEVAFAPSATTKAWDAAVRFYQCKGVSLIGSTLRGGPAVNGVDPGAAKLDATGNVKGLSCARGVFIHQSSGVVIEGCDISQFQNGIVPTDASGVEIVRNTIHDTRGSPITGGNTGALRIADNRLHTARPWRWGEPAGDHGDFIHLFITNSTGQRGVRIEGNTIEQRDGAALLGINVGAPAGPGFEEVEIVGNLVCNANHQAIRVDNVRGTIARNTLVTPIAVKEPSFSPGVFVRTASVVALADNLLGQVSVDANSSAAQSGNVLIGRADYAQTFGEDFTTLPGITAGARVFQEAPDAPPPAPEPPAPETIEIVLQPGQKLIVTAAEA